MDCTICFEIIAGFDLNTSGIISHKWLIIDDFALQLAYSAKWTKGWTK